MRNVPSAPPSQRTTSSAQCRSRCCGRRSGGSRTLCRYVFIYSNSYRNKAHVSDRRRRSCTSYPPIAFIRIIFHINSVKITRFTLRARCHRFRCRCLAFHTFAIAKLCNQVAFPKIYVISKLLDYPVSSLAITMVTASMSAKYRPEELFTVI